jgi:hypothetical protein
VLGVYPAAPGLPVHDRQSSLPIFAPELTAIYARECLKTIFLTGGIAEKSHLFLFQAAVISTEDTALANHLGA